jgi:hypothetical protein
MGGKVSKLDLDSSATSVTPAFRKAAWFLEAAASCDINCDTAEIQRMMVTANEIGGVLRKAFPGTCVLVRRLSACRCRCACGLTLALPLLFSRSRPIILSERPLLGLLLLSTARLGDVLFRG